MVQLVDALVARTQFGQIIKDAVNKQKRFIVSRRGKPKVVILSVEDYMNNIIKTPKLLAQIQLSAHQAGLDELTESTIEVEIKAARQQIKQKNRNRGR